MSNNDKTVLDLSSASPLSGTEIIYIIQNDSDKKTTINSIKFSNLNDTPSYIGNNSKILELNSSGTGLQFGVILGNIATHNINEFATVQQGSKADNSLQKDDNLSDLNSRQTALNNLTLISLANDEYVLTKDTNTGNALWKSKTIGTVTSVTVSSGNSYISSSGSPITSSGTITLTANIGTTSNTIAAGDDSRITGAAQKSSNLSDLASASSRSSISSKFR